MKRLIYNLRYWFQLVMCCQVPYGLWRRVTFVHPVSVVISSGTPIGKNVTIFQHVTIGRQPGRSYMALPVIEDDVTIYPGAVIAGDIRIGKGSTIGANTVVTQNVPPYCLVTQHGIKPLVSQEIRRIAAAAL